MCQDAHAQVVTWSSWSDFVANSVLAFFMVRPSGMPCPCAKTLSEMISRH